MLGVREVEAPTGNNGFIRIPRVLAETFRDRFVTIDAICHRYETGEGKIRASLRTYAEVAVWIRLQGIRDVPL